MKNTDKASLTIVLLLTLIVLACGNILAQPDENVEKKFKFSFSERVRLVSYDNAVTLSKDANAANTFSRMRTSVMGQWFPVHSLELGAKLTHEFRNYFAPSTADFHMNEVIFDQLYLKWDTDKFVEGTLTLGRQNIMLGEGFVIMDASPCDGSRTSYFNALRYDWNINKSNSLTFFYSYMNETDDLPAINGNDIDPSFQGDGSWELIEQDETGFGIYYTGIFSELNLQSYYIRKDYNNPDIAVGQVDADVNTVGSRIVYSFDNHLSSTLEGAYQFGSRGGNNSSGFGCYAHVDYTLLSKINFFPKVLTAGVIYLSGDDPSTSDYEGWDALWGRWPKWSESYIYTQIKEYNGKPAYWTNLSSLYVAAAFYIYPGMNLITTYHHMTAPETAGSASFPGGTGSIRGDLLQTKLTYAVNKNVSGHIVYERFMPGDYYFDGADPSNWTRFELLFNI